MMRISTGGGRLVELAPTDLFPAHAVWIDLYSPTRDEELAVERFVGVEVPTREEMAEIETSSRLYEENGALFMTANILVGSESERPGGEPVTFILTPKTLVTLRYADSTAFRVFTHQCQKEGIAFNDAEGFLAGLLDAIVDRAADILESVDADMDQLSATAFREREGYKGERDFKEVLRGIGRSGDLNSHIKESLVSIGRMVNFVGAPERRHPNLRPRMETIISDVRSLTEHSTFLAGKIAFLLDATLGFINIEQNGIIKIVSVASVAIMPPTLVASIYGMNFRHMPELDWTFGYPMALGVMLVAAVLPFLFFRRKGWL